MKKQTALLTMAQLGDALGVDRRQVWAWQRRRARNGFPAPVKMRRIGLVSANKFRPLYDLEEVVAWHRGYVPSMGGRPKAVSA